MSAIDDAVRWAIERNRSLARQHRAAALAGLGDHHLEQARSFDVHAELLADLLVAINARRKVGLYDDEGSPS